MNRTVISVIVLIGAILIAGYYFILRDDGQVADTGTAPAGGVTAEIPAAIQAAVDFCKEKGGTIETETIAEGVTHLCVMADGTKAEVAKFMADNQ